MRYDAAEYFAGLNVFQRHSNQHGQLGKLLKSFLTAYQEESGVPQAPRWLDIGCGDGAFSRVMQDLFAEMHIADFHYHGMDVNPDYLAQAKDVCVRNAVFSLGDAFDGRLGEMGEFEFVTGINAVYFASNWQEFKADLDECLNNLGIALFIQNTAFTELLGKALYPDEHYRQYCMSTPVHVYFPHMTQESWQLLESGKLLDIQVPEEIRKAATLTKQLIESMGGRAINSEAGQAMLRRYKERICSADYGGKGNYISDNILLVYCGRKASIHFRHALSGIMEKMRNTEEATLI